ncbi:hypothetical protein OKC48_21055 [Methylorubrum extorquens]|uniref:hypothetical protein n=1 Tax=Methylorubrum extorquens TaxID=408 RepID=UPI002238A773|nr:hypothetical protein [Methylorubrum extorquens]UYW25737.1 hypothetical protein OKC48_21055 [Methylorubrum extorquens]
MRKPLTEAERVLRILRDDGPGHELVSKPLVAPRDCLRLGWAEYGPEYGTLVGDRPARARTIRITESGRAALAEMEANRAALAPNSTEGRSDRA